MLENTLTVDIQVVISKDLGTLIDRLAGTVENTTQHVFRDGDLESVAGEGNVGSLGIDTRSTFKDLYVCMYVLLSIFDDDDDDTRRV